MYIEAAGNFNLGLLLGVHSEREEVPEGVGEVVELPKVEEKVKSGTSQVNTSSQLKEYFDQLGEKIRRQLCPTR